MTHSLNKTLIAAACLAMSLSLYFTATSIYIHYVNQELAITHDTLSHYVLGYHGEILQSGFYAISINQFILACLLYYHSRAGYASIFLVLSATGAFLVGYFPVQSETVDFIKRLPHISGAIFQFLFFPVAAGLIRHVLFNPSARTYTRLTAYITGLLFICLLTLFFTPSLESFAYFGLLEKINIALITAWLIYFPYLLICSSDNHRLFIKVTSR